MQHEKRASACSPNTMSSVAPDSSPDSTPDSSPDSEHSSYESSEDSSYESSEGSEEEQIVLPTHQELLDLDSKKPYVRRLKDGDLILSSTESLEWRLVRRGTQFLLIELEGEREKEEGVQLTSSLEDYEEVLCYNGYDPQRGVRMLLERLLEVTEAIDSEERIFLACAWLVQLSHDTGAGQRDVFDSVEELQGELHNMIIVAMSSTYDE